ncbi:MAG: glycosyltransferase [Paludibacter sp.]
MYKHLHIIAFDIPYPPNYGGAIDVFFRIKALSQSGVKIILHCFEYNRKQAVELESYCIQVFYYKRNTSPLSHLSMLPYTVKSRKSEALIANLKKDNYPILFDGLMCCYYLGADELKGRMKIYREANIEHHYYFELYKATSFGLNKLYYLTESLKFRLFEKQLHNAQQILAISEVDKIYYSNKFPSAQVNFIPCFHGNESISINCNQGDYLLYHGNLSVPENEKSAIYLCEHVFSKLAHTCIIAGMNPSEKLQKTALQFPNIKLIANPGNEELKTLVQNAQVHVLITFQSTGLKIKLLNTLFAGKHVVVNDKMVVGSGLDSICHIASSAKKQIEICNDLMQQPFNKSEIEKRTSLLIPKFSNKYLADRIIELI